MTKKRFNITLQDLYNLYETHPEYKGKVKVQTRFGFYPVNDCKITAHNSAVYEVKTESGKYVKASPDHLLYTHNNKWEKVKNLTLNHRLFTYDDLEKVTAIKLLSAKADLYDIEVDEKHEYYANGIVSHNSSMFSALTYALFGQTQEEINNKNVVNRYVDDKDMRLVIEFTVDDKPYKIVRGLTKGKQSYLELYCFNEDVTKSTIAETQEFIEKELLMCDMSIFLRTVMLTASQDYNFYKMKKADKKDFVEKLFDISVFGDMYQSIHRDILDFDKSIMSHQNKLVVLNRSEDDYKTRMAQYDSSKDAKLLSLTESIDATRKNYELLKAKNIKKNTEETSKLESAIEKIRAAKRELTQAVCDIASKNAKIELAIHKLNSSKDSKQSVIDKHSELLNKLCADCKPIFSEYYKIGQFEQEIADIVAKISSLQDSSKQNATKKIELDEKISKFDEKIKKAEDKIRLLTEKFNAANRELAVLENRMSSLDADYKRMKNETNPYNDLFKTNRKNIEAENAALEKIEERYKYLKFTETIVSQETLRKFIIADLIGLLNNKIKMYLTKMGSRYTVVFDSDMNYEFLTTGGECQFGNFSNGEKTRIMIATSFAFRDFMSIRNGLNTNILVCDEFFDSAISSACLRHIVDILREYVSDYKQNVYVITQRQEIEPAMIDNLIQVEKRNDISRITYPK